MRSLEFENCNGRKLLPGNLWTCRTDSLQHSSLDAPEVRRPSEPEVLWDPLEYPPEVELGQGLETPYDGLEHHGGKPPEPAARIKTKLSWKWLSFIALVFAAIIGGSLGGALAKRSRYVQKLRPESLMTATDV